MEEAARASPPSIEHPAEWKLAKFILRFAQVTYFVFIFSDIMHLVLYVGCFHFAGSMPPFMKACALMNHQNDPDYKASLCITPSTVLQASPSTHF